MAKDVQNWLKSSAIPLWSKTGVDHAGGGFFENLTHQGEPSNAPKRAMVQARQIYTFSVAGELGCLPKEQAKSLAKHGADFLIQKCSLPSGAFMRSVDVKGAPHDASPDLYTQAFALFGLAWAFKSNPSDELVKRAEKLVHYLKSERRVAAGGFTELRAGADSFESNPHMHLFEAAIAWMEVHPGPLWRALADEILELCRTKFIDAESGFLCEQFDKNWNPVRENGLFCFEPGHQYEWAWLIGRYEALTGGKSFLPLREKLFSQSETNGISPDRGAAYDLVWSDGNPRTKTSRFWPQCERAKAACQLGKTAARNDSISVLFRYLDTPVPGLWWDLWEVSGEFSGTPVKASSFYHFIAAFYEHLTT